MERLPASIACVGSCRDPEFLHLCDGLCRLVPAAWRSCFGSLSDLVVTPTDFDFVIVWQKWPDEHSPAALDRLLSLFPLARVLCVYGGWCESSGRTRSMWPAALRVPAWLAAERFRREFQAWSEWDPATPPWTASRDEVWAWSITGAQTTRLPDLRLHVDVSDHQLREVLAQTLQSAGARVVETSETAIDGIVVDADPWSSDRREFLQRTVTRFPDVAVWAVSNWLTPELRQACHEIGIRGIASKLSPCQIVAVIRESTAFGAEASP